MSEQQEELIENADDITPTSPESEEESFGIVGTVPGSKVPSKGGNSAEASDSGNKEDLSNKDSHAYTITKICICLVCIIWGLDFFFGKKYGSERTDTVIDLLKYVITASLSFFFGTSVSKNGENEK